MTAHLKIEDEGEDEDENDSSFSPPAGRGKGGLKRASVPNQCLQGFCANPKRTGGSGWYASRGRGEKGKSRNGKRRRAGTVAPYPLKQIMNYAAGRSSIMVVGFIVTTSDHRLPPGTTADIR